MYASTGNLIMVTVGALGGAVLGVQTFFADTEVRPFITVDEIRIESLTGTVVPRRRFNGFREGEQVGIADWSVTVVNERFASPSCQTQPGARINEGFSRYGPRTNLNDPMFLDDWAFDAGCWDRLFPGEHRVFTTWTPRDGGPPVSYVFTFEKPRNPAK